ncbi:MAG: aminopeptidase 1 [Elusimicrobia bacterium]|nr:aminopeptidase 1 [Elusimicrobiota bacterium]
MPKNTPKTPLNYARANGYEKLSPAEAKKLEAVCADYLVFLGQAKTERKAHDEAVELLEAAGFQDLDGLIRGGGALKAGDKVYRSCAGKTLLAAVLGRQPLEKGLHIVGGHTDSPRLDVKQNPLYESGEMALLDTHYYGGIRKYQWVAMPLALHGVFVKPDGKKIVVEVGEEPGDPVFCITDLLPHLSADHNKKSLAESHEGENLDVLVGSVPSRDKKAKEKIKQRVLELLHERYGVVEEDFLSAELEFVPAGKPREAGIDRSLIIGYGQDDRVCAYTALRALLDLPGTGRKEIRPAGPGGTSDTAGTPEFTACVLLCDKEEIGSVGATGMHANFFENTVAEMLALCGGPYSELVLKRALESSWMLSADVNALFDPLFAGVSEKKNAALLNQGTCLTKYTGSRGKSGASDASAEFIAQIRRIFARAGVVWQAAELGKVDQGGGGTIAYLMARYGMSVVDCGVALLSMHAPWEVSGKFDVYMTYKGFLAFLKDSRGAR